MTDLKLLITICLNFGLTFSKGISIQCQNVPEGICGRGQFVSYTEDSGYKCVDCPKDTFMDLDSHACEICKDRIKPSFREIIIHHGSSTKDNVVICREGYFRVPSVSPGVKAECERCSTCEDGMWPARACSGDQDTFCCQYGMIAVQQEADRLTCILPHARQPRQLQQFRKERSSSRNEHNITEDNARTDNNSQVHKTAGDDTHSSVDHGYSRADYATEYQHNKVEFPVWARILCAGVAVGVFLFYLGVGIPCNACGSRDMLRALRKRIFHQNQPVPTEEETKEKPTEKPKPNIDKV